MKELRDIVLNRGDIIYFKDCNYLCTGEEGELFDFLIEVKKNECDITKIERPVKYETIYEAPKQILDKEEKKYLEAVIRPFRDRVVHIRKRTDNKDSECIFMCMKNDTIWLPYFKKDTMYKGMEVDKEYTFEELGLFKE